MGEFKQELDPEVGVETFTLLSFSDGRPSELVLASTEDDYVAHRRLWPQAEAIAKTALVQLHFFSEPV